MRGMQRWGSMLHDASTNPREYAKIALRSVLYRRRLDLVAQPYPVRVATALEALGIDTVLDVGANIGQFGSALRASGYRGRLVSCEPLADAFAQLCRRSAADTSWSARRVAVGARPGTLELNVAGNSFSSSLLPMTRAHAEAAPGSEFVGTQTVQVTTIAELVGELGVDPARTMLKVDTQGYEAPVLDGAGELLGRLAAVALELSFVSLYEGQDLFDDLVGRVTGAGYRWYGVEPGFADPRTGRMLQCDGFFVRFDRVG